MMRALKSILKYNFISNARRGFHCSSRSLGKETPAESIQENPFCLEQIESKNYTLKKHDNPRRQRLYEFGLYVAACMPKYVQKIQMQFNDELEILIAPEGLFQVLSFLCLHQHACFNMLIALTAIDVPSRVFRFEVIYFLLSLRFSERIKVKTYTDELSPLHSACSLWLSADWYEREVYDMFGVVFSYHPDLRRILTDYGFDGHPLRKDYPLVGYTELRYDDELKKIVYEPVEFSQEMRSYKIESPWNYYNKFHEGYNEPPKPPKK